MKTSLFQITFLTATLYTVTSFSVRADGKDDLAPTVAPSQEKNIPISQEFALEGSYTGFTNIRQGSARLGGVNSTNGHVNYVISPEIKDGLFLRFGADAERNSFGLPNRAPLPNTLQSVNAIIGADMALGDKIIMRAEIHPGIFSDFVNVTGSDFDAPVEIGGTYLYSKDFQIIFGVLVDLKSSIPIIGIPGVRWQFADKWVLSAILPKPQLQYELNNAWTLYVGAHLLGGTYHLNDQFGTNHGHGPTSNATNFDGNIVDYAEVRIGVGFTYKFTPNLSLDVSGGYVPYRAFDVHSDHISFDNYDTTFRDHIGSGAPYAEAGISGSF